MKKPFVDKYEFICQGCGHRWIIQSLNKTLSREQLILWSLTVKFEHFAITLQKYFGGK